MFVVSAAAKRDPKYSRTENVDKTCLEAVTGQRPQLRAVLSECCCGNANAPKKRA